MIPHRCFWAILGSLVLGTGLLAQEPPPKKVVAITGGRVLLDGSKAAELATIVVADGKISAVGKDIKAPEGATIVDATGHMVAPSWIDAGNAGLIDPGSLSQRMTANDRVADLLVPFSARLQNKLLRAGVGCLFVDLGRSGRLYRSPTAAVAFVDPGASEVPVIEREAGVSFRVAPANVRQVTLGAAAVSLRNITGAFSAADRHKKSREKHDKAVAEYEKKLKAWKEKRSKAKTPAKKAKAGTTKSPGSAQEDNRKGSAKKTDSKEKDKSDERPKRPKPFKPDPGSDTMLRIMDGLAPLRVEAHWREDILAVLGIAKEKKVQVSILGASEAWRCIDELKEAGASVVLGSPIRIVGDKVLEYQAPANLAKVLAENGIPIAFMTGLGMPTAAGATQGYRFDSLPLVASLAMAEGLSWSDAFRALTAHHGEVIGMGERLGKIAVGYDAALQVLKGDPLAPGTTVEYMILGDRVIKVGGNQ